jgi:hypothetical protein
MKTKYIVRVNVSYTKKYIVDAESVQDAEERSIKIQVLGSMDIFTGITIFLLICLCVGLVLVMYTGGR